MLFFPYGKEDTDYLSGRDGRLGVAIEKTGRINRPMTPELFPCLVRAIVGQQVSRSAQATVYRRMEEALGAVTPQTVCAAGPDALQKFGMTFTRANNICALARAVEEGKLDLCALKALPDKEVIARLTALPGIGPWTAEMALAFSMGRPDIFSWGDLAIHRGIRMLYDLEKVGRKEFEDLRARFSPRGTVASLYLWAVAAGALPDLRDPARDKPKNKAAE